jgi:hypothetical protein
VVVVVVVCGGSRSDSGDSSSCCCCCCCNINKLFIIAMKHNNKHMYLVFPILVATYFGLSNQHPAITQTLNVSYMQCILCSMGSNNT